jgi:DNA-binding transcriptional LysR family regulator
MRYRQIDAFRNVMVTGTTTGAANSMAITQPAVSRLVSDLEENLGFKLFERYRGRLLPTQDAMNFYQAVDQFYMGFDRLERVADQIRMQHHADIKVCATPALSTFTFPESIRRFKEQYPAVHLLVESFSSSEIVTRLQTHMAHLAITQAFPEVAGIAQETLIEANHVCVVHESHRLAKKEFVTVEDFIGEEVLAILPSGLVNWNSVHQVLNDAGIKYNKSIGIQNSHTGYSLVSANLAIALIEPFAGSAWLENGVVMRPFLPSITFRYVLAYPLMLQRTEPMKAFAEIIMDVFRKSNIHSI